MLAFTENEIRQMNIEEMEKLRKEEEMKNNRIYNDLAEFLTNMVKQGATDDELSRGVQFSADVIKSYNANKVGEIFNKYMGGINNGESAVSE